MRNAALIQRLLLLAVPGLAATVLGAPQTPTPHEARISALYFDPLGADFTAWIDRFRDQAYRHWLVPDVARKGAQGCTQFRFTVSRDGGIRRLLRTHSSSKKPLDQAAETALKDSSLLPLPSDYPAQTLTVDVAFFYNTEAQPRAPLCTPPEHAAQ